MQVVTHKVPGGKLLRLKTETRNGVLHKPQLSGDFFIMPAEKLDVIETALDGWRLAHVNELADRLLYLIESEEIVFGGFSVQDIVSLVKQVQP